jgi:hypothetical protein
MVLLEEGDVELHLVEHASGDVVETSALLVARTLTAAPVAQRRAAQRLR